jgi:NAD(P)-dependent dehydrogenase (short-subunit alcohol dehydrogenase family)
MSETKKLQGKVAAITGGTTGIGLAAAKLFVNEGAYVFITGRRQKELDEAVQAIGGNVRGIQGDVAKLIELDRLYEAVESKGKIDVVFCQRRGGAASLNLLLWERSPRSISTDYSTSM